MRNRILAAAALTAGALLALPTAPAAAASDHRYRCHHRSSHHQVHQVTGNNYGILNGTQIYAPIDILGGHRFDARRHHGRCYR